MQVYLLLSMRTKKGQRVNSIPTVLLSDKYTINWEVKTAVCLGGPP